MTPFDTLAAALDQEFPEPAEARIGVAVSGGGDSMCLMVLLADWAQARGAHLEAASVDHGLRPEAATEIATVAERAAELQIPHQSLSETGWNPGGNLQNAARDLRQRLLRRWAQAQSLTHVCLGHTEDDQAETFLLRLVRGSGVDGLSAMSPRRRDPEGLMWLRPLLSVSRAALREELTRRGIGWAEDPSNDDVRFDRVRARMLMTELEPLGLRQTGLAETAHRMRAAREVLASAALQATDECIRLDHGDVAIAAAPFFALPDDTRWRLFAAALCWVTGDPYRPRFDALCRALETLADGRRVTLHGCLCGASGDQLRIGREPSAVSAPVEAPGVWDNRWQVATEDRGLTIAALGEVGLRERPAWRESDLPRDSLLASPALWQGPRLYAALLVDNTHGCQAKLLRGKPEFTAFLLSD